MGKAGQQLCAQRPPTPFSLCFWPPSRGGEGSGRSWLAGCPPQLRGVHVQRPGWQQLAPPLPPLPSDSLGRCHLPRPSPCTAVRWSFPSSPRVRSPLPSISTTTATAAPPGGRPTPALCALAPRALFPLCSRSLARCCLLRAAASPASTSKVRKGHTGRWKGREIIPRGPVKHTTPAAPRRGELRQQALVGHKPWQAAVSTRAVR